MALNRTPIPTCDFTWNLYTGCLRGCSYCYAGKLARGRLKPIYLSNPHCTADPRADPADPFCPRYWQDREMDPLSVPKRHRSKNSALPLGTSMIFAIDMGDIFGPWIPRAWQDSLFNRMELYPNQIFQILTKFPFEMLVYQRDRYPDGFPQNIWAGVTINTLSMIPDLEILRKTKATTRYVCAEPLTERIRLTLTGIHWLIIGPQTNPLKLPDPEWVYTLIDLATRTDTAVFVKNIEMFQDVQEFPLLERKI